MLHVSPRGTTPSTTQITEPWRNHAMLTCSQCAKRCSVFIAQHATATRKKHETFPDSFATLFAHCCNVTPIHNHHSATLHPRKALRCQQPEDFSSHTVNRPQSEGNVFPTCAVPQAPTKHVRCEGSNTQSRGGTSIIPSLDQHRPCHVPLLQPFPLPRLPCRLVSRVQIFVCAPPEVLCSD